MRNLKKVLRIEHFFKFNLLFWIILCLFELSKTYAFTLYFKYDFTIDKLIIWPFSKYLIYWALSYWIFEIYLFSRRFLIKKFVIVHLISALIFSIFHKVFSDITGVLLHRLVTGPKSIDFEYLWLVKNTILFDLPVSFIIYWLAIIILLSLDYYKRFVAEHIRFLEIENRLNTSQLRSLKMQLQPHFLFNALNTISMMIRQKANQKAIQMVSNLSDMLRYSLTRESNQFVSLSEELELVEKYLQIESERFSDRLTIEWEIDQSLLGERVPGLILQPIVENAFKHGISRQLGPSRLRITVKKENENIAMEVFNTGPVIGKFYESEKGHGLGLHNTVERLNKLYMGNSKIRVTEKNEGLSVTIHVPVSTLQKDKK